MQGGGDTEDVAHGASQQVTVMALDACYAMVTSLSCFGRRAQSPQHLGPLALRPGPGDVTAGARPSQAGVEVVAGSRADRAQRSGGPGPTPSGCQKKRSKRRLGPTAIDGGQSKRQWVLSFAPHPNASPRRGEGLCRAEGAALSSGARGFNPPAPCQTAGRGRLHSRGTCWTLCPWSCRSPLVSPSSYSEPPAGAEPAACLGDASPNGSTR